MASFKEKLDKNGNRIYEVQASNGRGRRVWRTFRPEPTWMYGDNVFEKCGINRDGAGEVGKPRYFNGKRHF